MKDDLTQINAWGSNIAPCVGFSKIEQYNYKRLFDADGRVRASASGKYLISNMALDFTDEGTDYQCSCAVGSVRGNRSRRELMIRQFKASDEVRFSEIRLKAGLDEYTYLPQFQALDKEKALQVFHKIVTLNSEIWLADDELFIKGFVALQGSHIDRLYVDPEFQRQGIGKALVQFAKERHPGGLELRTHQQNRRACQFYQKHGFEAVKYGISPQPESVPDVEYYWRPKQLN